MILGGILHAHENQLAIRAALQSLRSLLQTSKRTILDARRTQRILIERNGAYLLDTRRRRWLLPHLRWQRDRADKGKHR
jgi:hypothetical protein